MAPDNELYRGYTIVTMVDPAGEIRVMDDSGEYFKFPDWNDKSIAPFETYDHAKAYIDAGIRNGHFRDLSLPRERIERSDENKLQFVVTTPGGELVAKSHGDVNYPSLDLFIGGHCYAFIEWHPDSKQFNFHYYGKSDDEPLASFHNITDL